MTIDFALCIKVNDRMIFMGIMYMANLLFYFLTILFFLLAASSLLSLSSS